MSTMQLIVIGIFAIIILKLLFDKGIIGKSSTQSTSEQLTTKPIPLSYVHYLFPNNELLNIISNMLPGYKTILAVILLTIAAIDVAYSFLPKWLHDVFLLSGLALGFLSLRAEQHKLHYLLSKLTEAVSLLEKKLSGQSTQANHDNQSAHQNTQ